MKVLSLCVVTGLAFGLAASALAQQAASQGDVKYCNALAKSYQSLFPLQEGMPVNDVVTLSRCDTAPRETIAMLEKKLADKKIDLPHDDRVAQPPGSTGSSQ
jgi:hypothetical protein